MKEGSEPESRAEPAAPGDAVGQPSPTASILRPPTSIAGDATVEGSSTLPVAVGSASAAAADAPALTRSGPQHPEGFPAPAGPAGVDAGLPASPAEATAATAAGAPSTFAERLAAIAPEPGEAAAPQAVLRDVPLRDVAVTVGLKSLEGLNRFDIRLTPDELGRIDIRLDLAGDGVVNARLVADRPETLAFLQRESGSLERALEQAGLRTEPGGLSLSLRDGSRDGHTGQQNPPRVTHAPGGPDPDSRLAGLADPTWRRAGGLDLRI